MYCRQCGYNLPEGQSGVCPKCGRPFDYAKPAAEAAKSTPRRGRCFAAKATAVFSILATLTACYIAAYVLLIVPAPDTQDYQVDSPPVQPVYRFGGDTPTTFFQPVFVVDRWLFPTRWRPRERDWRYQNERMRREEEHRH